MIYLFFDRIHLKSCVRRIVCREGIQLKARTLDKHINDNEPWAIQEENKLKEVLQFEIDELRKITEIIEPITPETSSKVKELLKGPQIKSGPGLFPRVS